MTVPKVSVIIPNYNHSAWLGQRIDSVLDQTFQDFELILLDDCSSDGSAAILEEYKEHPKVVSVILNSQNSGNPFKQWKRGVDVARGEWIWIAESDDYASPAFLEEMLNAVAGKNSVGLAYCDSAVVDDKVVRKETFADLKNKDLATDRWSQTHQADGKHEIQHYLLPYGTINNTSAVLFKRDIFLKANVFDMTFRYMGDKYAFLKVLALSDILYVNKPLNYFRNPFNTKHGGVYMPYVYEHFLIFHWALKNLNLDRRSTMNAFYRNTQQSLLRGWNRNKLKLNSAMFTLNPGLFARNILHNLVRPFK